jgi:ChrR-like protein with cupin domain
MDVDMQAWRPEDAVTSRLGGRASHRVGTVEQQRFPIETGLPGYNLSFSRDTVSDGFFSPLHRHCWDQLRFVLDGSLSIGQADLEPGDCGYFPEAVAYGPQQQAGDATVLVLQFTGAGGLYYPAWGELEAAAEKLRSTGGTFEGGRYKGTTPDGSRVDQDGYEAMWEAQQGRKLVYPQPRYSDVVIMKSSHYEWLPDPRGRGVEVKALGSFTEYQTTVALLRLAAGSRLDSEKLAVPQLRYVLSGTIEYGGQAYPAGSCFWVPAGAPSAPLDSTAGAELYTVTIPRYADL